jgi:hypothetical protein
MRNSRRMQARLESFFWKIPGDVPGYSRQPDPYQGVRQSRNTDYQGPVQLGSGRSRLKSGLGAVIRQARTYANPSTYANSRKWLLPLLLLLFMSGLGIVGYKQFFVGPNAVATGKAPKIFELTLGERFRTNHSQVRIITHVVVKGDTLWDIANTYVKDPFRYPELAKLSRIKNPDLIYPYDLVRIRIYEGD